MSRFLKSIFLTALFSLLSFSFNTSVFASSGNKEKLGDVLYILLPASAYASTFYFDDKQGRWQFYKSVLANTIITLGLNNTVKKSTPKGEDKAFPSGHTSSSFQSAVFFHKRYGLKLAIPHYLGASYVAYSRVDSNNHDTSDVLAGALVGGLSSYYFTTHYKGVNISPAVTPKSLGVKVGMRW